MVTTNKNIINIQKINISKCTTTENHKEREQEERNQGNTKELENN